MKLSINSLLPCAVVLSIGHYSVCMLMLDLLHCVASLLWNCEELILGTTPFNEGNSRYMYIAISRLRCVHYTSARLDCSCIALVSIVFEVLCFSPMSWTVSMLWHCDIYSCCDITICTNCEWNQPIHSLSVSFVICRSSIKTTMFIVFRFV